MQKSLKIFHEALKTDSTRHGYEKRLEIFLKFTKIRDYDSLTRTDTVTLQKLVEGYLFYLKDKHRMGALKASSFGAYFAPIELFFVQNDIVLNFKKIRKMFPSREKVTGQDPFTTNDIAKMLEACPTIRWKAIIHFLASTGSRPGEIFEIKMKHLKEMEDGCMAVKIYADSAQEYWTFLTPEATNALKEYFDKRTFDGEKITPESLVFRNHHREGMAWFKVKPTVLGTFYSGLAKIQVKAGIRKKGHEQRIRHDKRVTYGFRKRFNTILKLNNDVNSNIAEKLMNHKRGLDGSYFIPTIDQCFKEFKKAIPELTIDDTERLTAEKQKLVKEKNDLEKKLPDLVNQAVERIKDELRKEGSTVDFGKKTKT